MKLYGNRISTCTRTVLTTLAEKGQEVEFVPVDLWKGEQKSAEHRQHQPFGRIPALEDDGFAMYESRAILRYLDDTLPGTRLTPSDVKSKARMEQWISVESSYFSPTALKIIGQKVFHPMLGRPTDMSIVETAKQELTPTLDILAAQLTSSPYLAGESFSLADICYLPYVDYLFAAGEGALIASRPPLAAWWQRVAGRPSWQKAIGQG